MSVRFLSGARVYLRPVEEADLPAHSRWINDPAVRTRLVQARPLDLSFQEVWWKGVIDRSPLPTRIHFAVCLTEDDALIGITALQSIDWVHRFAETSTVIGEASARGKGLAAEIKQLLLAYAFDTLDLHRLQSRVLADNTASLRHLKRCGYVEEGRLRQSVFTEGGYRDEILLGLLGSDWRAQARADS